MFQQPFFSTFFLFLSCLGLQQSVAIAEDIKQAIWVKRVMLQFQEVLSICKIEYWCELTTAIPVWGNVDLCLGQKYLLKSGLGGEGVKI